MADLGDLTARAADKRLKELLTATSNTDFVNVDVNPDGSIHLRALVQGKLVFTPVDLSKAVKGRGWADRLVSELLAKHGLS